MKQSKVPIGEKALLMRVNRKLASDGEQIRKARGDKAVLEVGEFYRLDVRGGYVIEKDVDLEASARKLGILKAWEVLEK